MKYCRECGDDSLPPLADLVSDTPDPMKGKILAYLRTNIVLFGLGYRPDALNPTKRVNSYVYSDGTYKWTERFAYYVDEYNIPVPSEFREHILENFNSRMKRHALFRLVDSVEIHNNPYLGYQYNVRVYKSGMVQYCNVEDCRDGALLFIKAEDASLIIEQMMQLFCYDCGDQGHVCIDAYHWELLFYRKSGELIESIEGWDGEDPWRHREFQKIIAFAERYIPKDLGLKYME